MTNCEKWQFYLKDISSPDIYIRWSYYFIVSTCLARRVWLSKGDSEYNIYPNLYLILVAPPGIGKTLPSSSAVDLLKSLSKSYTDAEGKPAIKQVIRVSPDTCTLESLYQHVAKATEAFKDPETKKLQAHASLCVCIPNELGLLLKDKYAKDVVRFLNTGYDCKSFERTTKHQGNDILQNMCLNFAGCCTVDDIADFVKNGIISTGFSSRAFFIFADTKRDESVFISQNAEQKKAREELRQYGLQLASQVGRIELSPEAFAFIDDWNRNQKSAQRANSHPILSEYYGRKKIHVLKMSIVCHYAEKLNNVIDLDDVKLAMAELALIERDMHKAFGVMSINPIYNVATEIVRFIGAAKNHELNRAQLMLEIFRYGSQMEIGEALNFLQETQQIIYDGAKKTFKLAEKRGIEDLA